MKMSKPKFEKNIFREFLFCFLVELGCLVDGRELLCSLLHMDLSLAGVSSSRTEMLPVSLGSDRRLCDDDDDELLVVSCFIKAKPTNDCRFSSQILQHF